MTRMNLVPLLALLSACDPFGHWPDGNVSLEGELWDTEIVPSSAGGIYAALPGAHALVHARPGDVEPTRIDLDGAEPVGLVGSPDFEHLLAFSRWPLCDADTDDKIVTTDDCPDDELEYRYELNLVEENQVMGTAAVPGHMNALEFSPDFGTAVAYLDYQSGSDIPIDGVVDLSEVVFVDLDSAQTRSMSIGFSPSNILFTQQNDKAVVLSRSQAMVIDLETFEPLTTYPLTLDADAAVDPVGAQLTPDGRFAVISVDGSSDLYTLDLEVVHVDIKELVAPPSAMWVSPTTDYDHTVVAYGSQARLDVFDHTYFNREAVSLEEPCNEIIGGEGFVVAFNDAAQTHDVYKLGLGDLDLTEYVVANPVDRMELIETDGTAHAVAVLRPESGGSSGLDQYQDANWGLAVMDMATDDAVSLVVEAEPVGLALAERGGTAYALVLLDGVDTLLMIDLTAPSSAQQIELPAPPVDIGAMADGSFYITHDSPLGLVSVLDPADPEALDTISGFATIGLFDEYELPRMENN